MSENSQITEGSTASGEGKPVGKRRRRIRAVLTVMATTLLVILAIPVIAFFYGYLRADIPEPQEMATAQVSTIYASDGTTQLARIVPPEGNRTQISLAEIPKHVQDAVLAAEDREFWSNPGFSFTGFARAVLGVITGNASAGGGSTVTQQYVKNTLVGDERSFERKWNEMVYSIKMTNEWDKETILEAYLNTVYFGRNAYGIEAASNAYFNKSASELTVEEAAVLAGVIQLPSANDPWNDRTAAVNRWNYVLDGMVEMDVLSTAQRAGMQYPETRDPAEYSAYTEVEGTNGHIKNQVMAELMRLGLTEEEVNTRGLSITTTIDMQTQNGILEAVNTNMAPLAEDARTGIASVEPTTGAVRGYYGGEDPNGWDYANAGLQTGSTFKIFGLAAALQQGIPLSAQYSSAPVILPNGQQVNNVTGSCGVCSIENALQQSYNTSFIRLQDDLENNTQDTADMAHALGMARELPGIPATLTENGEQPYEGIVLGQYQSRPLDLAIALGTIANRGVYQETHFVEKVEAANQDVLYEWQQGPGERRVSAQVADNLLQAMGPIAAQSGKPLAGGRPSASKTGTAQFGNTGYNKDAWMLGTTPQLSTAVWVGTETNTTPIFNAWGGNMYGSNTPATIWKMVMDSAHQGKDVVQFHPATPIRLGLNRYGSSTKFPGNVYDPFYTPEVITTEEKTTAEVTTTEESETDANESSDSPEPVDSAPAPAPAPAPELIPAPAPPEPAPAPTPVPGQQNAEIIPEIVEQVLPAA